MPSYSSMNKDELIAEAEGRGVSSEGTREEIIERLERGDGNASGPTAAQMVDPRPFGDKSKVDNSGDGGASQVQDDMDEAQAKGYFGYSPDLTPRHHYGALHNDAPTPETDPDMRRANRDAAGLNQ